MSRMPVTRTTLVAWMVAGLLSIAVHAQAQDATAAQTIARQAVDHLISLEEGVKKQNRRYVPYADIVKLPNFVSGAPEPLRARLSTDPDNSVAGYIVHLEAVNGGDGFIVMVVEQETGFAVRSDDSGFIQVGTSLDPETKKPSRTFLHFARAR